jgi:hypothetical protein
MEVASPLTFPGSKRSFACSGMEEDFVAPVHKRRRFDPSPFSSTTTNSPFHPSKVAAVASFGKLAKKTNIVRVSYRASLQDLSVDFGTVTSYNWIVVVFAGSHPCEAEHRWSHDV